MKKNVLLGMTGSVAAYKSAELVRLLKKDGADVKVVMTKSAQEMVSSLLMHSISGHSVHSELFGEDSEKTMEHISLARWADILLIAPASANFMAKLACGICDDLLSTMCLAANKDVPIMLVPAMNVQMWNAQVTQHNLQLLKSRGTVVFGPNEGGQACGEYGFGRMLEPVEVVQCVHEYLTDQKGVLSGCRVLLTAGPTHEHIDPVRYMTSASSGKMGYALAQAAADAGAHVTLISGPTNLSVPSGVQRIDVTTASQMMKAVMSHAQSCDVFIAVAAVADYHSKTPAPQKLKKTGRGLKLTLEENTDILASVAALPLPPITVGFAAETEDVIANATKKLSGKGVDMIVANQVGENLAFNQDENRLFVLRASTKEVIELPLAKKSLLAKELIKIIAGLLFSKLLNKGVDPC